VLLLSHSVAIRWAWELHHRELGDLRPITQRLGTTNMFQSTWTNERIELLKERFEAGLSCREIAIDIGVSRNAVIGKLSRLNLTRKDSDIAPRPARRGPAKQPRAKAEQRFPYQMLQLRSLPRPLAVDEPIQTGPGCSLLELSEARCRWPISTPGADDFCFCGNEPVEGLPYCVGHSRLAYRQLPRPRIVRRERYTMRG
jgi:GcrA cell cycle regulator